MWGSQRFLTGDASTNSFWVAMLTFGEGWHNNHHAAPQSARHGLAWYEFDLNWYGIMALRRLGLAWDIKLPRFRVNAIPHTQSADGENASGKLLKDGSRIDENYGEVSNLRLKAFVYLDVLAARQLFPLPPPESPIEESNRSDPYSGRTIPGDDIAWVMHSQINARKSDHSNQDHRCHPDAEFSTSSARTSGENGSEYSIKTK
jgi:hypothetical protein